VSTSVLRSNAGVVASPCIDVCSLAADGICIGCGRSLDEIAAWSALPDDGKRAVLERARARRAARGVSDAQSASRS
jgi:predicted Fe-S protein YdhL (DUF1289 family)